MVDPKSPAYPADVVRLDQQEAAAVLAGDFEALALLWAADMVVNNPFDRIVPAATGPVRTGRLRYTAFERRHEAIRAHRDTVIVMGYECVTPTADSPRGGLRIERRFTHVWIRRVEGWRLAARHANQLCATLATQAYGGA